MSPRQVCCASVRLIRTLQVLRGLGSSNAPRLPDSTQASISAGSSATRVAPSDAYMRFRPALQQTLAPIVAFPSFFQGNQSLLYYSHTTAALDSLRLIPLNFEQLTKSCKSFDQH